MERRRPTIPQEAYGRSAPTYLPTSGRILQHKRLFHSSEIQFRVMVPMSSYRGWASVDNLGMKFVSAANILKKERSSVMLWGIGASLMALTFTSVGRRPCSEKRSSKQKVL